MIPSKRPSPFTRARSFQPNQTSRGRDGEESDGPPFIKRAGFARTLSNPFQVLSPTLKNVRNPFEKLALSPKETISGSVRLEAKDSPRITEDDTEDEFLDPNTTLKMFSMSQPTMEIAKDESEENHSTDEDEGEIDDLDHSLPDTETLRPSALEIKDSTVVNHRKLRLHEALENPATSVSVPLDWTMKNSIIITSQESLAWCDQVSPLDEIKAMQVFVSAPQSLESSNSNSQSADNGGDIASIRTRFLSRLFNWTYPPNTPTLPQAKSISRLLKSAGQMSSSEKNNITDLFSRSTEWKQAFKALYQACRSGSCPYFYYIGTVWTILFQHGGVSFSGDIEAILTHSTPGLREVLREEDIVFERLPNVTGKTTIHNFSSKNDLENFDDNASDATQEPKTRNESRQQTEEQTLSDTLLFRGQADVHGLFGYLLNLKTSYEDGFLYQSPTLVANVPFLHSALKRAQVSKCRTVSRPVEGTDRVQKEFRVDIQGFLLPTSVRDLHLTVASQQQLIGYNSNSESDARSLGLNLRGLLVDGKNSTEKSMFVSPKSLDQLRYDHTLQRYLWMT
ncbi:hypothetical protein BGZ98_005467 [Dissophora globulifera]|nr:hypothetical protein BGZ98_005467 [Dissophora globulifera]